jgi:hypothetical protein
MAARLAARLCTPSVGERVRDARATRDVCQDERGRVQGDALLERCAAESAVTAKAAQRPPKPGGPSRRRERASGRAHAPILGRSSSMRDAHD